MARLIVSREAEEDINEILGFIADDNFEASMSLYSRMIEIFEMSADNPLAGRERDELKEGLRCFPSGSYLIFYRVWAGKVSITRVLHAARDLDEAFS